MICKQCGTTLQKNANFCDKCGKKIDSLNETEVDFEYTQKSVKNHTRTKNEDFNKILEKFYEHGILKEVYSYESAIVCNIMNKLYCVFVIPVVEEYTFEFGYPAFVINSLGLRAILEDDLYVFSHYQSLTPQMQEDYLVLLNDNFFQHMIDNKSRIEKKPPNPEIVLPFEAEVIEKGKGALRTYSERKLKRMIKESREN